VLLTGDFFKHEIREPLALQENRNVRQCGYAVGPFVKLFCDGMPLIQSEKRKKIRTIHAQLHNLEGNPAPEGTASFIDLPGGHWYTDAVRWAAEQDLISGYDSGEVGAGDPVTREQLAVILWRYAGCPESDHALDRFSDLSLVGDYALPALRWANEHGIVNGIGEGRLDPASRAVRVHVAQVLKNYLELQQEGSFGFGARDGE